MTSESEEIGHSGGKITFEIDTNAEGQGGDQMTVSGSRPVPMVMIVVNAASSL